MRLTQKGGLNQQQLTGVKPHACLACANGVTPAGLTGVKPHACLECANGVTSAGLFQVTHVNPYRRTATYRTMKFISNLYSNNNIIIHYKYVLLFMLTHKPILLFSDI